MARNKTVLIVGGGISGLFAALLISNKYPSYSIVIAERAAELGGLYSSFRTPTHGFFDHGPHLFYDSGVDEVDRQIRDILPDSDWICLSDNRKDIAGIYHNGYLQTYSHYPDIRRLDSEVRRQCFADFFQNLGEVGAQDLRIQSAEDYFKLRFGNNIAEMIIEPILQKMWGRSGQDLDPIAAKIVSMDRVILFDKEVMPDLMASKLIQQRLAYPDQLALPLGHRVSKQCGFYPKKFGLIGVISAIRRELANRGVKIITGATLGDLELQDGDIVSATIGTTEQVLTLSDIHLVHWTAGLVPLARQLGVQLPQTAPNPGRKVVFANLFLRSPPNMGEIYYFYCYDSGYKTFRVTNYSSYCPDAGSHGGNPISIELHLEPSDAMSMEGAADVAASEMLRLGVVESPEQIVYRNAEASSGAMPAPTLAGKKLIVALASAIEERKPLNLTQGGPSPDKDLFFLHDVLADSYKTLLSRGRFN